MKGSSSYSWTDYGQDILHEAMPWIVFACVAFVVFILAIVIRFIKAVCCKSRIKNRSDQIRNVCVIVSFIVTFLAMGCCGFIIHYSDSAYQSYMQIQCTSGRIPYALLNGNIPMGWLGLSRAQEDLQNISDLIENKYGSLTTALWSNTDWLDSNLDTFSSVLEDYYNNYTSSSVSCPNPLVGGQVALNYIANLGDPTVSQTYTYEISQEYQQQIVTRYFVFQNFRTQSLNSIDDVGPIVDGLASADDSLGQFVDGNEEVNSNIKTWIRDNQGSAKNGWRAFSMSQVLIGWFICIGVLVTVSAQALNRPKLAHGLCVYWVMTGLLSILGFVLCIGLISIGIVSNDSCGLVDSLMTPEGLKEYDVVVPDYVYVYMDICLNGDGNIEVVLGLNETLNDFVQLINTVNLIDNLGINPQLADFASVRDNYNQIQKMWNYVGIVSGDQDQTSEYSLNILNLYTNNALTGNYLGNCSSVLYDQWVFNQSSCSNPVVFPNTPTQNLGGPSCLVISFWGEVTLNSRYQDYLKCTLSNTLGDYLDNIKAYQSSLLSFQTEVSDLSRELVKGLQTVNDTINKSVSDLITQTKSINDYVYSPSELGLIYTDVYGQYGLLNTLNCSFVRHYVKTLKKSMCDNTRESIYQVFIFIFVLSFLLIVLEFVNLYLSRALLKPENLSYLSES